MTVRYGKKTFLQQVHTGTSSNDGAIFHGKGKAAGNEFSSGKLGWTNIMYPSHRLTIGLWTTADGRMIQFSILFHRCVGLKFEYV